MSIAPVAVSLPTLSIGDDETALINFHLNRLTAYNVKNKIHEAYHEGKVRLRNLGTAVPPELQDIETVVGWPGSVVEVLDERLDWLGWASDNGNVLDLDTVFLDNMLDVEGGQGHLDGLIYGTYFVVVGSGYDGEPSPLITIESPKTMTGEWDGRIRRLSSALSIDGEEAGRVNAVTLYLPNENISLYTKDGVWKVEDRDEHNAGRVLVAQGVNRPRAGDPAGRSEITRPLRAYTDAAVRTMLGMEVHREFYQAPQRYALGVDGDAFTDKDGNVKTGWEAVMGRMLALPRDEDGELPVVGQFAQSSPQPYLSQVQGLAQLVAGEAGIPSTYLGFYSENPTSADAIRAAEARLIKRAERRQASFGRTWREVGALALLVRDGEIPEEYRTVYAKWRDPATPTRSAAADEATKLVGAGILPPDSSVTYDRLGFSPAEQRQLASDKRRAAARQTLTALTAAAQAATTEEDVNEPSSPTPPSAE